MNRFDGRDCFDLHDNSILDEQVKTIAAFKPNSLVLDGQRPLPFKG